MPSIFRAEFDVQMQRTFIAEPTFQESKRFDRYLL